MSINAAGASIRDMCTAFSCSFGRQEARLKLDSGTAFSLDMTQRLFCHLGPYQARIQRRQVRRRTPQHVLRERREMGGLVTAHVAAEQVRIGGAASGHAEGHLEGGASPPFSFFPLLWLHLLLKGGVAFGLH